MLQVITVEGGEIVQRTPVKESIYHTLPRMVKAMKSNENHDELIIADSTLGEIVTVARRDGKLRIDAPAGRMLEVMRGIKRSGRVRVAGLASTMIK